MNLQTLEFLLPVSKNVSRIYDDYSMYSKNPFLVRSDFATFENHETEMTSVDSISLMYTEFHVFLTSIKGKITLSTNSCTSKK